MFLWLAILGIQAAPAQAEEPKFYIHPVSVAPLGNQIIRTQTTTPNDPLLSSQYGHTNVALTTAWDSSRGSYTVRVGVIDTGIDGTHEDLITHVGAGYNFITNAPIAAGTNSDDNGHGTLVAGVIGANTNNATGIAGVNWDIELIPLKVANANGEATASALAAAIRYAADNNIRIVNMSLGSPADFPEVRDAVNYAAARNVLMVASSGNNNSIVINPGTDCATVCYPAAYDSVIAVGSVGATDVRSSFSNYGPELDLVAPGESIISVKAGGGYSLASGTSMSAPYVTGIAALIRARFDTGPSQFQMILQNEADKPVGMNGQNFTNEYGYGRVNAARAVRIHASYVSQNANPTLYHGEQYQFEVVLRNTGNSTWRRGQVNLGTDRARDRVSIFTRGAGWISANRVELVEATVAPNATGTFRFTYSVSLTTPPGTYREYFRPVFDNVSWLEDIGIYWDITVRGLAEKYHASWVSQNAYPTLLPGQSYQFEVVLRNIGEETWQQGIVKLGTDRPTNRTSTFITAAGWSAPNRVELVEATVAPNATGTFRFTSTIPPDQPPGTYREYFRALAENITFMEDLGIYWDVTVLPQTAGYRASYVSQNAYPTLSIGQSYQFEVTLRNTGLATWQPATVRLGTDRPADRTPIFTLADVPGGNPSGWLSNNRVELVEESVAPNATGTFRFYYTVPTGTAVGTYREYFRAVADGITWMDDLGIYWDVTVQ